MWNVIVENQFDEGQRQFVVSLGAALFCIVLQRSSLNFAIKT